MSSKKCRRNVGNKHFPIAESVSIALKIQLDRFIRDENETELKFPSFLSAQERGFIHETVAKLGLKSKSRGKGKCYCLIECYYFLNVYSIFKSFRFFFTFTYIAGFKLRTLYLAPQCFYTSIVTSKLHNL